MLLTGPTTIEWFQIYTILSEIPRKSMVNTAELRQIFPLRGNTLRHVVESDGRYPRAMTPSVLGPVECFPYLQKGVTWFIPESS